ncbi:MAG: primosomal protein N', partial [Oscillospiraceae bacterium]|nr:primosomal protein N' [Oscillospiraceae bacterium]
DEYQVLRCCAEAKELLQHANRDTMGADVLGPAPYPIVKLLGRFRYRLMLRCSPDRDIRAAVAKLLIYCNTNKAYRGVSVFAEMDPLE